MMKEKQLEIIETVKDVQSGKTTFKSMSYFPWETDVKKERHGRELIEVTAFINAVKKAAKSRNNVLMWHFSTSKEADRRRGTISVRKATHKELRPLEVHLKKNKIYARWGKVGRRKK